MSEVVSRHAAIWLTLDAGGTLGRLPQSLVRSGSVVALAGLASLAMFSLAAPVAIPMVREPQMRVLLHEGKQVLLRADRHDRRGFLEPHQGIELLSAVKEIALTIQLTNPGSARRR